MEIRTSDLSVKRARALRREMSKPEVRLWGRLRKRGADGFKFRRQHPIGPFILDFFCAAAKLAIEIDGAGHGTPDQVEHDRRRDGWLRAQGIEVMRLPAARVLSDLEDSVDVIWRCAAARIGGRRRA